jgi:hypothetical protein
VNFQLLSCKSALGVLLLLHSPEFTHGLLWQQ